MSEQAQLVACKRYHEFVRCHPVVITQPPSCAASVGKDASLVVGVVGEGPLSFCWRRNGVPLGASRQHVAAATLVLPLFRLGDEGYYDVEVSNRWGSVLSAPATMLACLPPTILEHPLHVSVRPGDSAVFSSLASGSPPLQYRWFHNGRALTAATDSVVLVGVTPWDEGEYHVMVKNAAGAVSSRRVRLTLKVDEEEELHGAAALHDMGIGGEHLMEGMARRLEKDPHALDGVR